MFDIEENIINLNPNILYVFNSNFDGTTNIATSTYHNHDFLELSIITSGYAHYNIEDNYIKLIPGQVLVLNPGVHHQQLMHKDIKYSDLHIGISNIKLHQNKNNFIDLNGLNSLLTISKYRDDFIQCCYDIINEQNEQKLGYALTLKALTMKLIIIILRELDTSPHTDSTYSYLVEYTEKHHIVNSIIKFMNENYMTDISLDKISKNMYLSPVYISKLFKEEIGYSPINYLIKIRLDKSAKLLEDKSYTIKEVAKMVGYNDVYHYSKQFKKHYGITPSKFTNKSVSQNNKL
ncbi:MAG: AraC family transcriptional regulator [Romboutsia sp.]